MQHMRIQKHKPNIRHPTMDMPILWNKTPQKHQRRKKHTKRSNKNNHIKKRIKKNELISQRGIAWQSL